MILDTSFLIDVMRGDRGAVEKNAQLEKQRIVTFVTTPTIFELFSGLSQSMMKEEEQKKIREVLKGQTLLELDIASAREAGMIDGSLQKKGGSIGPIDSMIAGIARTKNKPVLTRNVKDFKKTGVTVETY